VKGGEVFSQCFFTSFSQQTATYEQVLFAPGQCLRTFLLTSITHL